MRTNIGSDEYRPAQPVGAPSVTTADAAWGLLGGLELAEIMPAYISRKNFPAALLPGAKLTAKQALVVALDTAMVSARDHRLLYATTVFDALARIWSATFRNAKPASTIWDMAKDTVDNVRRELLLCGVDIDRLWSAVAKEVPGLYTIRKRGNQDFARGRRVRRARGAAKTWRGIIAGDGEYQSPRPRVRLLRADQKVPALKIDQSVAAERVYDRMEIGDRSKAVIARLQRACLFLDVAEIAADAKALRDQIDAHPWRPMLRAWEKQANRRDRDAYQTDRKAFMSEHAELHKEFLSLSGQSNQLAAIARAVRHQRRHVVDGFLGIRAGYFRVRNRRWQSRHFWTPESSSHARTEVAEFERLADARISIETSPRGNWFYAKPFSVDARQPLPEPSHVRAAGLVPIYGADISSSMVHIIAVLLGRRSDEAVVSSGGFKDGLAAAVPKVAAAVPEFRAPDSDPKQRRKAMGILQNIPYGVGYGAMAKGLRDDPVAYGTGWGNLRAFIEQGQAHDAYIKILADMRAVWLGACRALVEEAAKRDAYAGVSFVDPFDGATVRWHTVGRARVELGSLPLTISAPLGKPRDGEYPVNYFGVERPVGRDRRMRAPKLHENGAKVPLGWRLDAKGSLSNMLAPCLIHTLDAAFAGCVVELLAARGLRDFAIVHDCFLVPADDDATNILHQAIVDAGRSWFLSLHHVYDMFDEYLGKHPVYGERVRQWRQSWKQRSDAGNDWPEFHLKTETTQSWKIEPA